MDPMKMLKFSNMISGLRAGHPKVEEFIRAAIKNADEGTVIEMTVTTAKGSRLRANIKLNEKDMELINNVRKEGK